MEAFAFNLTPAAKREIEKIVGQDFDFNVESRKIYFKIKLN